MKYFSYAFGLALAYYIRYCPNHVFAPTYSIMSLLLTKDRTNIKKVEKGWLIQHDRIELLSPTPKFLAVGLGQFEHKLERYFKIEMGDTVLDVGACIGDTTVPMAIKTGPTGKVIAVEPNHLNVEYLRLNLAQFNNADIVEKGIWKTKGALKLHLHGTPTGHSIMASDGRKAGSTEIEVDTLDNLFGDIKIDFAKIDVQEAEVQVLEGGDRFLKSTRKLLVETHDRTNPNKRTYPKVLEILKRYDYQTRFAMDNGIVYAWK